MGSMRVFQYGEWLEFHTYYLADVISNVINLPRHPLLTPVTAYVKH